eukprot:CAMPEP_0185612664 /NCGR_PEP_ID=MMETSP0436-20130131/22982_1 /TAXON_ID=626734 ORGANISM="Favella taraikaensis, Strain Fe Narragansett Bay" /NCGR_SAMPLE_ID=MMETSP0436 /ASSEMBLY_ACC=CAM_ASM_000390 /LENGTH=97 /DNA_ID=CAMNT_0028246243 /DNA_START=1 /DNA_END=291 /DNA_ORIENTATION=-
MSVSHFAPSSCARLISPAPENYKRCTRSGSQAYGSKELTKFQLHSMSTSSACLTSGDNSEASPAVSINFSQCGLASYGKMGLSETSSAMDFSHKAIY